jgi:hypothetical protein
VVPERLSDAAPADVARVDAAAAAAAVPDSEFMAVVIR